jgi:hypothetical protein
MSFVNDFENTVLNFLFGDITYAPSGDLFIGLSTTTPAEDGTSFSEPGSGAYERVEMVNDQGVNGWEASTTGQVHNRATLTFPTATEDWGTVTYFGIFDLGPGTASGDLLAYGQLDSSKAIETDDTASFASGALSIELN